MRKGLRCAQISTSKTKSARNTGHKFLNAMFRRQRRNIALQVQSSTQVRRVHFGKRATVSSYSRTNFSRISRTLNTSSTNPTL
jgi:hypothetical protein